jgi:Leucine-rich repeat (LRR) protein
MMYYLYSIMEWTIKEYNLWLSEGALINENVVSLDISHGRIISISNVNRLPMLEELHCYYNKITDIQGLQLPMLQELYCYHNQITDIQGLQLPMLQMLYCSHNQITNIQELQLPMLQTLYCNNNQITDIQDMQLPRLQTLFMAVILCFIIIYFFLYLL